MKKMKKISWKHRPGMSEWEGKVITDGENVVRFVIHGSYCVTDLGDRSQEQKHFCETFQSPPDDFKMPKSYKITDSDNGKEIAHDLLNGLNLEIHEANYQAMEDRSRESANTIAKAQEFLDSLKRKEEKQNEIDANASTIESQTKQLAIKHHNEQTLKTEYSINPNAETIENALLYLEYRHKQLLKFGVTVQNQAYDDKSIITYYNTPFGNMYGSIYILKQFTGNQLFIKNLQIFGIAVLTLEECGIVGYLEKIKCNHIVLKHSDAYKLVQQYYGDKRTKRYGVPLIYHIDEGGYILNYIGASDIVKDAYYLHPLLQSDEDFNKNLNMNFGSISTESIILAMEYRRVANSYLSTMSKSSFVGFPNEQIKDMLLADKIQNYKDFMKYHKDTHKRSVELEQYFLNWFELLDVSLHAVNRFIEQLEKKQDGR